MKTKTNLPAHVAIIMDGNGRWANRRGLPRVAGHSAGVESVREVIRTAVNQHIPYLTLWAFGRENWSRPKAEIEFVFSLLLKYLKKEIAEIHQNNICFRVIGERTPFSAELQSAILEAENLTANNTGLVLTIAINYSGRWDIVQATQMLAEKVKSGLLDSNQITEVVFKSALCLADVPEPDLVIRTSGEKRISNFFLWQFAYTELYFSEKFWPDFTSQDFILALQDYGLRERRFGGVLASNESMNA